MHDEEYKQITFENSSLEMHYESCRFVECTFTLCDLSERRFEDCDFVRCKLDRCGLSGTRWQDVRFEECELLGLDIHDCSKLLFQMSLHACRMELCALREMDLVGHLFLGTQLIECDFSAADLSKTRWQGSRFERCIFEDSILDKADLRETHNLRMRPERNSLRGAMFDLDGLPGLLSHHGLKIGE